MHKTCRLALHLLVTASGAAACGAPTPVISSVAAPAPTPESAPLVDGLYAIWGSGADEATARSAAGARPFRMVPYDDRLGGEVPPPPREWLALSPATDVPFVLSGPPVIGQSDKGFASLMVTLGPDGARALEAFTRDRLGHRIAVAVGGEVVSTHGVKAVITGGLLQITRCTDDGCELLRTKLARPPGTP